MVGNTRLIDVQKDLIIRFSSLYDNLKKESKERRTIVKLQQYETERILLTNKIMENNMQLVEAGAPPDYTADFTNFETTNKKYMQKLKEFYSAININYLPQDEQEKLNSSDSSSSDNVSKNDINEDVYLKLKEAEARVAELERDMLSQQQNNERVSQDAKFSENATKREKIDELLTMLVKSQIQQINSSQQPRASHHRSADVMNDVPVFSGDVSEYKAFKQIFRQSMSSQNWSPVEKFLKLRSKLQDSPKDAISSLYIEDNSYELAWEILDRNYLNPRQLLEHDIVKITNSNFVTKAQDAKSHVDCKNTFVNIAANVKQLKLSAIDVLVQFTILRMDNIVRGRFEDFLAGSQVIPTEEKLVTFLEKEARIYQNANINKIKEKDFKSSHRFKESVKTTHSHVTTASTKVNDIKCFLCGLPHSVTECATFLASNNREGLLRFHKICIFCTKHRYSRHRPCNSRRNLKCDNCDEKHITAMHPLRDSSSAQAKQLTIEDKSAPPEKENTTNTFLTHTECTNCTILPTAIANVVGENGILAPIRCLVDLGSESSYICSHVVQILKLRKYKTSVKVKGINGKPQCSTSSYVNLQIKLKDPALELVTTKAYVLPSIADTIPSTKIKINPEMTDLADPLFNTPALIGVLLGSDVAPQIYKTDVACKITEDGWLMQPTHLGWIVCGRGKVDSNQSELSTFVTLHETMLKINNDKELNERILKFYEIPEEESSDNQTENEYCEKLYTDHHYRENDGRYVVPTPWKLNAPRLGHSFRRAVKFFLTQENRWRNNEEHYIKSNNFMEEYLHMGHMSKINNIQERFIEDGCTHTLSYISVFRKDALTTKLRNVFNASLPTSNGISLNDTMYEGRKLQCDIFNILTKMRSFKYFFSADIEKMFRQVKILPEDKSKMRIVWRSSHQEPLEEYELNTVTYGTDAAPWQAIRTIHQCAFDNAPDQKLIKIIKESFYVDDLLHGADTITECQKLINEIITTMDKGKFPLTKWLSNKEAVLKGIPSDKLLVHYMKNKSAPVKILGLPYDRDSDQFFLKVKHNENFEFTKRGFCSAAASLYDPLGFVLPVTMRSRLFIQNIWKEKYGWDDILPDNLKEDFISWYKDQKFLADIKIQRWLSTSSNHEIELIGFSDASGVAKAAVIYSRIKKDGQYHIQFVAAKGNVNKLNTPRIIKSQQNTIPKNELDAVVILIELYERVRTALEHCNFSFRAYLDSKVALSWIRSSSKNENKFIRKRVEKIQKYLKPNAIHYVKSEDNPADPASRGMSAEKLRNCVLWKTGPSWLSDNKLPETPVMDAVNSSLCLLTHTDMNDMFERISKFITLIRVIVFIRRWKHFKRNRNSKNSITTRTTNNFKHHPISADEVEQAKIIAMKYYQQLYLSDEYAKLTKNQLLNKRHWLRKLSPFIDDRNLICVGGRLMNADIPQSQRHPIIIPPGRLTKMLIEYTHLSNLHAGNSLTIQKLISEFYIKGIKRSVYHILNACPKCLRWKARSVQPEMSQLPKERVESGAVFEKVGVDLAGPMQIKASNIRNNKVIKIWVAVFVCLVTKATHLEIVSSLTTVDFLAALARMTSRRGPVKEIWSDNGTNFQGANRMIKEAWNLVVEECIDKLSIQNVKWKFIPRHSPTFGGLWEACVKSMKYFVKRMEPTTNFTYEEFYTLLCKIEALLNSRPLCTNPVEPSDSLSLTPFHFITNRRFEISPIDALEKKVPLTKKWLTIIQLQRDFWKKFNTEYLYSLQKKQKWINRNPNLKVGDVVLIKEPSITPGEWKMGRISKLYTDPQGVVRKADVTNAKQKTNLEAINQLIPITQEEEEESREEPSTPSVRTNTRKNRISATQVLITWLTLTSVANAFNYTLFSPGVHIVIENQVYIKTNELNLIIETQLNLKEDLSMINETVTTLETFCGNLRATPILAAYCWNVSQAIEIRAKQTTAEIMNIYKINNRQKRWSPILTTGGKYLLKYGLTTLVAAGVAYQEYEIYNLKEENAMIKERIRKTSMLILNITDLEHDEVDGKLTEVINSQQELNTKIQINSYLDMISILIDIVNDRHSSILNLKPYNELENLFQNISTNLPDVIIPPVNDIFSISHKEAIYGQAENVRIIYKIPLIQRVPVTYYGIVNIPDKNGFILDVQKTHYLEVLVNHDNSSYYLPTFDNKVAENIYEISQWEETSGCFSLIFHRNSSSDNCKSTHLPISSNRIIALGNDVVLTFSLQNITAFCDNEQTTFYALASLVYLSNCTIMIGSQVSSNITIHVDINKPRIPMILAPPITKVSIFKPHQVEIEELKEQLEETINDDSQNYPINSWNIYSFLTFFVIFVLLLIILITVIGIVCYRGRKKRRQNTHWEGPEANEYHMVPQSTFFLEVVSPKGTAQN